MDVNVWTNAVYSRGNEPKMVHSDLFGLLKLIKLGLARNEMVYKEKYKLICISIRKKSYINMFIFLTLIFSTIAGNRINSFSIPFAIEAGLDANKSN